MDVAGSGRSSVPVLCFRDLCFRSLERFESRVPSAHPAPRGPCGRPPLCRRVLPRPARRPARGGRSSVLRSPEAETRGDVICAAGEVRGARGTGLWPRLADGPEARPRWLSGAGGRRNGQPRPAPLRAGVSLRCLLPGSLAVASASRCEGAECLSWERGAGHGDPEQTPVPLAFGAWETLLRRPAPKEGRAVPCRCHRPGRSRCLSVLCTPRWSCPAAHAPAHLGCWPANPGPRVPSLRLPSNRHVCLGRARVHLGLCCPLHPD